MIKIKILGISVLLLTSASCATPMVIPNMGAVKSVTEITYPDGTKTVSIKRTISQFVFVPQDSSADPAAVSKIVE